MDKMSNKDKRRLLQLSEQAISVAYFIKHFLGVGDEALMRSGLNHHDLSQIFPDLTRIGWNYVLDNPEDVYIGKVILVKDVEGNIVPYLVSDILKQKCEFLSVNQYGYKVDEFGTSVTWVKVQPSIEDIDKIDLSILSIYELQCLLKEYLKAHKLDWYHVVRRELISRKDSIHGNKESLRKARCRELKLCRRYDEEEYN